MSRILPLALVLLVIAPSDTIAHRHRADAVSTSFAQAWNNHSAAELADLFAEDGTFAHPFAVTAQSRVAGRSSLQTYLTTLFGEEMSKSTYTVNEKTLTERQIGGQLYVIEFEATITNAARMSPLEHRATMVLEHSKGPIKEPAGEKHAEHWSIAALSLVAPLPEFARNAPKQ